MSYLGTGYCTIALTFIPTINLSYSCDIFLQITPCVKWANTSRTWSSLHSSPTRTTCCASSLTTACRRAPVIWARVCTMYIEISYPSGDRKRETLLIGYYTNLTNPKTWKRCEFCQIWQKNITRISTSNSVKFALYKKTHTHSKPGPD